jgi:hypothetical protein
MFAADLSHNTTVAGNTFQLTESIQYNNNTTNITTPTSNDNNKTGSNNNEEEEDVQHDLHRVSTKSIVRDPHLVPFDDSISMFSRHVTPQSSFILPDPHLPLHLQQQNPLYLNSKKSTIRVPLKFYPPRPSVKYSRREKYGEYDMQDNPIVSVKLEIAENEVLQLRSDLDFREQEFLQKFEDEKLVMVARMERNKRLREEEARKTAEQAAEMARLRRVRRGDR